MNTIITKWDFFHWTKCLFPSSATHEWSLRSQVSDFILGGSNIVTHGDCSHEIKRCLLLGRKVMTNLDRILKSRHCFSNKGPSSQSYGFSSGHIWMWELDYKESWVLKNWRFSTVVLEETLESPLDCKEIQPVHPEDLKSFLNIHWKDWSWNSNTLATWCEELTNWKDWRREEKGTTEDEMVGWHHQRDGHEFE